MQQAPNAPTAPTAPGLGQTFTITGVPGSSSPAMVYRAFRAQRSELQGQMEDLQDTRRNLRQELQQTPAASVDRTGLEQRITGIDARITAMDKQMADAEAAVAKAAAIPGAVVEPPRFVESGPPQEVWVLSGLFIVVVLLPLSIAYARRIWRRGSTVVAAFPKEIAERLGRLEQATEATAIEVERIGEGQRFLTRLFTEGEGVRALAAPAGERVPRQAVDTGQSAR